MEQLILVLNPGSTSTKLAVFRDGVQAHTVSLTHSPEQLAGYKDILDQRGFREQVTVEWLRDQGISLDSLTAIVARGGMLAPVKSGAYRVNSTMVQDLEEAVYGKHASNLAALIAHDLAAGLGIPAFIVDPVSVDELCPAARISGNPRFSRRSVFHALNHKATAKKAAALLGKPYERLNLILAHLGGGISVAAHCRGRVIDVNDALVGEGPFSPERSGTLPGRGLVEYFFQHNLAKEELIRKFAGRSGFVAYLQTNDAREVERRLQAGDQRARFVFEAMCYQIAKEIGRNSSVLCGIVDQIVLTGGLAYSGEIVEQLKKRVEFIAPLMVLPGENELEALALGALAVLNGAEEALEYEGGEVSG